MKFLTDRTEIAMAMNFGKYPVLEMDVAKNQFKCGDEIHGFKGSMVRIDSIYKGEHLYYDGELMWFIDEQRIEVGGHGICLKASFGYEDVIEDLKKANAPIVDAEQEFILILHNSETRNCFVIKMQFEKWRDVNCMTMLKAEKLPKEVFEQLITF